MNSTTLLPPAVTFADRITAFSRDIKLSHTLFAMPFALLSMTLAAHRTAGGLRAAHVVLIVLCMVFARTVAMAANRLLDARFDAANPRTARRAIPSGVLSKHFVMVTLLICAAGFIACCGGFWWRFGNPWPLALSVPVLLYVCGYPFMKRFTRLCHYYLGAALALAPVCAWLAVKGSIDAPPLWMAAAITAWTAGFDILYACQDYEVDVAQGLYSVPATLGIRGALSVARLTHLSSAALFITLGLTTPEFGSLYFIGAAIAIALLGLEHALVRHGDLSKLNLAFFTINGIISLLLGTLGIVDVYV